MIYNGKLCLPVLGKTSSFISSFFSSGAFSFGKKWLTNAIFCVIPSLLTSIILSFILSTPSLVDIRYNAKEGFDIGMDNGKFVILNAVITDSLKKEGNAREFVSKVQAIRKESNFDIDNRIKIYVNADEEFASSIKDNLDYVKNETLAIEINFDDSIEKDLTLNEYSVGIKLERVS